MASPDVTAKQLRKVGKTMIESFEVPRTTKLKKGDILWYKVGNGKEFGYYVKTSEVHATFGKGPRTPFGSKKGQIMIWIWNPDKSMGPSPDYENVVLPRDKIIKISRFRPESPPSLNPKGTGKGWHGEPRRHRKAAKKGRQ